MAYLVTAPVRRRGMGAAPGFTWPSSVSPIIVGRFAAPSGGSNLVATGPTTPPPAPTLAPTPAQPSVIPAPTSAQPAAPASSVTQATAGGTPGSVSVPSPPPSTWPTDQPYTDAAGNVWNFNPASGWQISATAGSSSGLLSGFSMDSIVAWLQSNTLISAVPNWGTLAGGIVAIAVATSMMKGKRRR